MTAEIQEIIDEIQSSIEQHIAYDIDMNGTSYSYEEGVIISANKAIKLLEYISQQRTEYAGMLNGEKQEIPTLDELRKGKKTKQIKECSDWLAYCVSIGYDKNSADELEKIYWKFKTTKP